MICWVLLQKSIPTLPESQQKNVCKISRIFFGRIVESVSLEHMLQTWRFLRFFHACNRQNRPTCYTLCALSVFTRRCTWAQQKLFGQLRISWIIKNKAFQCKLSPCQFAVSLLALVQVLVRIPRFPNLAIPWTGLGALMACPDLEPDFHQAGHLTA